MSKQSRRERESKKQLQSKRYSWKQYACLAAGVTTLAMSTLWYTRKPPMPVHFPLQSQVERIETIRQKYLDDLLKTNQIPYCSGVVYDHTGDKIVDYIRSELASFSLSSSEKQAMLSSYASQFQGGKYDVKTPEILELSGKGRSSKIFVGRELFEVYTNLTSQDIRHILVAHEGRHAYQHAQGPPFFPKEKLLEGAWNGLISSEVLYRSFEVDANYSAIKRVESGEFSVSKAHFNETKRKYMEDTRAIILATRKASPLQHELVESLLMSVRDLIEVRIEE